MHPDETEALLTQIMTKPRVQPKAIFVGAGVSIDSGLPSFQDFSRYIVSLATGGASSGGSLLDANEIGRLSLQLRPEVIVQLLMDDQAIGRRILEAYAWLEGAPYNANHVFLARALQNGHSVFTTNIDPLIEDACHALGIDIEVVASDEEFGRLALAKPARSVSGREPGLLLKLHGSIEPDTSRADRYESIQFSLNQVGMGLSKEKRRTLVDHLERLDFVFLGYSACDHFSVQPVLVHTATNRATFWLQFSKVATASVDAGQDHFQREFQQYYDEARAGTKRYEETPWENISVAEILSHRRQGWRWRGHTSDLIRRIVVTDPPQGGVPPPASARQAPQLAWALGLAKQDIQRVAAKLHYRARNVADALRLTDQALANARTPLESGRLHRIAGDAHVLRTQKLDHEAAVEHFEKAFMLLTENGAVEEGAEALVSLTNALRRARDFPQAMGTLARLQPILANPTMASAATFRARALIAQALLSERDPLAQPDAAFDDALGIAKKLGDVALKAAVLNAWGLSMRNRATGTPSALANSTRLLSEAFDLFRVTGDPRGCFQALRNRGLNHLDLASRATADEERDSHLAEASRDFDAGERYLLQLPGDAVPGEIHEIRLQKGRAAVERRRWTEARDALSPSLVFHRTAGDWHQEARTLGLFLRAEPTAAEAKSWAERLMLLYESILRNPTERAKLGEAGGLRAKNAAEILAIAESAARRHGLEQRADDLAALARDIAKAVPP